VEIDSHFSKKAYSGELKRHMYVLEEYHLCKKQEHLGHCFPVRVELVFASNTFYNLGF
jgi:hypothetical protein